MSEKRFVYGETDLFEWVEDNGTMISTKECVDLLNELSYENEQLKEENEQLRKELDRYKVVILQFVLLLVENGIMDSSVKEEVDGLLEELSGDGV